MSKSFIVTSLFLMSTYCFGQYDGIMYEIYFTRQPSPRIESMGRGGVALDHNNYFSFYNPSLLGTINDIEFTGSYIDPGFYFKNGERYNFLSIAYPYSSNFHIGFSRYYLDWAYKYEGVDHNGVLIFKDKENVHEAIYTLTTSYQLVNGLYFGLNANYARDYFHSDYVGTSFPIDLGMAKFYQLGVIGEWSQKMSLGLSYTNVLSSKLTFPKQDPTIVDTTMLVFQNEFRLPSIARVGLSYILSMDKQYFKSLRGGKLLLHAELQNVRDTKYYGGYHLGSELTILEMLSLRLGYNKEKNYYSPKNSYEKGTTYGLGLSFPLHRLSDNKIPLVIKSDYSKLDWGGSNHLTFKAWSLSIEWLKN